MRPALGFFRAAALLIALAPAWACSERDRPACGPEVLDYSHLLIHVGGTPLRGDPVAEVTVVQSTRSLVRLEADPVADPVDERYLEIDLEDLLSDVVSLPQVGDVAVVRGGDVCENGGGYGRVSSPAGDLLFEGGDPSCGAEGRADWEPAPLLAMRRADDPRACWDQGCISEAWEITLTVDGVEEVLAIGQPQEVQIDGRRYLAEAQYARFVPHCDLIDGGGVKASAYVAPIAD